MRREEVFPQKTFYPFKIVIMTERERDVIRKFLGLTTGEPVAVVAQDLSLTYIQADRVLQKLYEPLT